MKQHAENHRENLRQQKGFGSQKKEEPGMAEKKNPFEEKTAGEQIGSSASGYDKTDRNHIRFLLKKAYLLIDLIASGEVPLGTAATVKLIDSLDEELGYSCEEENEDDVSEEVKNDRYSLINLYAAVKKKPGFLPLYSEIGLLLRKYGLFDEEVVLLENALEEGCFNEADLEDANQRLLLARLRRDADDAGMTDEERTAETLRRELQQPQPDADRIKELVNQCMDDAVLYEAACSHERNPEMKAVREKAARKIHNRDFQYALSSHIEHSARTSMILNLYDSLEGDELFIARTILTDPNDENKAHMLLYCEDEELLMLGWKYVYGARKFCRDRLHAIGSRWPEAYEDSDPEEKAEWEEMWMTCAGETALDLISEDREVQKRIAGAAVVDSDPLCFYLSLQHPRKAIRWWHARKLKNPARIAYVGSWTKDDPIKEALSVKIRSTALITEMIYGDLSAADLVFAFEKPEDLTIQNRFLVEIMKNNPDRTIREHVRKELLRGKIVIPGVDLTEPDPLFKGK